jgi:hypothetical protein
MKKKRTRVPGMARRSLRRAPRVRVAVTLEGLVVCPACSALMLPEEGVGRFECPGCGGRGLVTEPCDIDYILNCWERLIRAESN